MNLLCPNCQKMLTVPEQYAGQMMKCPLCAGDFMARGISDRLNDPSRRVVPLANQEAQPRNATRLQGAWGLDLGQCALKALRLQEVDGQLTATAFDYVEYPKILS